MLKKYGYVAAGLLMSMTMLSADNTVQATEKPSNYSGGAVAGFSFTTLAGAVAQVGYIGPCFTFDIGGNFINTGSTNFGAVISHLGFRSHIYEDLYFSGGLMGLGNFYNKGKNEWSAGVFTGLDYQISRHFILSGKVYPYNYDHRVSDHRNNVFADCTIGFFYVF